MDRLPTEILCLVMQHFHDDPAMLLRLRTVSKRWKSASRGVAIALERLGTVRPNRLIRLFPHVWKLSLDYPLEDFSETELLSLTSLASLRLDYEESHKGVLREISTFSRLTHLFIATEFYADEDDPDLMTRIESLHQLKELMLPCFALFDESESSLLHRIAEREKSEKTVPQLERLEFRQSSISSESLSALCQYQRLKTLAILPSCYGIETECFVTPAEFRQIARSLTNLISLSLPLEINGEICQELSRLNLLEKLDVAHELSQSELYYLSAIRYHLRNLMEVKTFSRSLMQRETSYYQDMVLHTFRNLVSFRNHSANVSSGLSSLQNLRILGKLTRLEVIDLHIAAKRETYSIGYLSSLTNLEHLELNARDVATASIDEEGFAVMASNLSKLKRFIIDMVSVPNLDALENCTMLETLAIHTREHVSDFSLSAILLASRNSLTHLFLNFDDAVFDGSVLRYVSSNLTSVSIRVRDGLSLEGCLAIAKLPKLEELTIVEKDFYERNALSFMPRLPLSFSSPFLHSVELPYCDESSLRTLVMSTSRLCTIVVNKWVAGRKASRETLASLPLLSRTLRFVRFGTDDSELEVLRNELQQHGITVWNGSRDDMELPAYGHAYYN